jgi:hypothetical protein
MRSDWKCFEKFETQETPYHTYRYNPRIKVKGLSLPAESAKQDIGLSLPAESAKQDIG